MLARIPHGATFERGQPVKCSGVPASLRQHDKKGHEEWRSRKGSGDNARQTWITAGST